jgi:diguanylate cyclase (GGDEF)-like protein
MREYLDLCVLANWVCMLRSDVDGAIWIADDEEEARFYERCAHHSGRVVPAPTVAVGLLQRVELRGAQGVVATVRAPSHPQDGAENVFRPSVGDVASLLVLSRSWDYVTAEVCGPSWLRACEREVGSIRTRGVSIACSLEALSQACLQEALPPVDLLGQLAEVIRWDTLDLAWDHASTILSAGGLSLAAIERVRSETVGNARAADISGCDGMAVVSVLAAATQFFRPRGIRSASEITSVQLVAMLRAAFDLQELDREPMIWSMRRWERRNSRYPLLAHWRLLDPLRVLLDQRYWEEDLACILGLLGPTEQLAAFKMDLDDFRSVNNSLGHAAGDDAIRLYGSVAKDVLGSVGEVYRRGGDEIVAFAPGLDSPSAQDLAERARSSVEIRFREWALERGLDFYPTASIGVAVIKGGCSMNEVVRLMDEAQHEAKRTGKNRVVFRQ